MSLRTAANPLQAMKRPKTTSSTNTDLISTLPDDVLHHIMGLLTAKEVLPTRFLSKSWERLWITLPFLILDSRDFSEGPDDKCGSKRFVKFVYALLLRRKPSDISVFSLSLYSDLLDYKDHVTNWISHAVQLNPQVLRVSSFDRWISLPQCIYTCASLLELHLSCSGQIEPRMVNLPKLRKLSIRNALLPENQLNNILLGCPVLDDLCLDDCYISDSVFTHRKLRNLTLTGCKVAYARGPVICLILLMPSKTTLNMPSLTYARFGFRCETIQCWKAVISFLSGLGNSLEVLEVQFTGKMLKEKDVLPKLPVFQKLQELSVDGVCRCFHLLAGILECSPNLKKLTFLQDCKFNKCCGKEGPSTSKSGDASLRVAISQCKSLELVEVKYRTFDHTVRWLVDALVDGTKELKDVKTLVHGTKELNHHLHY